MSLMFFHRGLRLRPELENFRLGVQKAQDAIQKTIGGIQKAPQNRHSLKKASLSNENKRNLERFSIKAMTLNTHKARPKTTTMTSNEKREASKLLGELFVDKEYLENLIKHPNLKRADTGTESVSNLAKDAVRFLDTQQEFWRQQRPCTALPKKKQINKKLLI